MERRRKLPKRDETAVLTRSGRRCCVCFGLHGDTKIKAGQIAHLDGDRSNDTLDNLAWLCLFHHAAFDTRSNVTKGFTSEEVKVYRARLHDAIEKGSLSDAVQPPPSFVHHATFNTTAGGSTTVINAIGDVSNYTVRGGRKANPVVAPPDAIGSRIEMRSYVEYLVGRYIEWRKHAIEHAADHRPFFAGTINKLLKSKFL